jgi:hypothetical protein
MYRALPEAHRPEVQGMDLNPEAAAEAADRFCAILDGLAMHIEAVYARIGRAACALAQRRNPVIQQNPEAVRQLTNLARRYIENIHERPVNRERLLAILDDPEIADPQDVWRRLRFRGLVD